MLTAGAAVLSPHVRSLYAPPVFVPDTCLNLSGEIIQGNKIRTVSLSAPPTPPRAGISGICGSNRWPVATRSTCKSQPPLLDLPGSRERARDTFVSFPRRRNYGRGREETKKKSHCCNCSAFIRWRPGAPSASAFCHLPLSLTTTFEPHPLEQSLSLPGLESR